jgi:single-stranded DNA-binding protein
MLHHEVRVIVLGSIKTRSWEKDGQSSTGRRFTREKRSRFLRGTRLARGAKAEPAKANGPLVLKACTEPIGDENEDLPF